MSNTALGDLVVWYPAHEVAILLGLV